MKPKIIPFCTCHSDNDFQNQPVMALGSLSGCCISVTAGIYSSDFSVRQTWFRLLFSTCITLHLSILKLICPPFFQLILFCEVFLGYLTTCESVVYPRQTCRFSSSSSCLGFEDEDFTVHCFSQVISEHSQRSHVCSVGRTGGRVMGPCSHTSPETFSTQQLPWLAFPLYTSMAT